MDLILLYIHNLIYFAGWFEQKKMNTYVAFYIYHVSWVESTVCTAQLRSTFWKHQQRSADEKFADLFYLISVFIGVSKCRSDFGVRKIRQITSDTIHFDFTKFSVLWKHQQSWADEDLPDQFYLILILFFLPKYKILRFEKFVKSHQTPCCHFNLTNFRKAQLTKVCRPVLLSNCKIYISLCFILIEM